MMLVAAIQEHYAEGKKCYVLVSGVEIGTKPQHTDYQSSGAIMKKRGIDMKLGYYLKPRNRVFEETSQLLDHFGEGEAEKKCKVNDVIIDMRALIEAGKEKEAFEKYPRNFMQYGEKLKAMHAIRRRFFQLQIDDLLKIVGLALIPEYERKQLKKQGNEDPSKLFMNWSYVHETPTSEDLKSPEHYQ
ncbi:hypothetical protein Ae201684P_004547 [Aphanomyces euteiches]|nr:hypothetical protein Ae201684P_004547 [Aphanomyces euteiches]